MQKFLHLIQNFYRLHQTLIISLTLVLLCVISYANALPNGISWDDRAFLVTWRGIQQTSKDYPAYLNVPELLGGDLPSGHQGVFRPLRSMFYLLSYSTWGDNYFAYHLQAVIFHIFISLLVFAIARRIGKSDTTGFITAAIFAVHPIHTESVSYITASFDTLGILFYFLSFYFYLKKDEDPYKKNIYLFASALYFAISAFFYEMTLTLPLVIVLYEYVKSKYRLDSLWKNFKIYRHFLLIIIFYLFYRFVIATIGNRADYLGQAWYLAAIQARFEMPMIYLRYIKLLVIPQNLTIVHLMPDYLSSFIEQFFNLLDPGKNLLNLSVRMSVAFIFFYLGIIIAFCRMISLQNTALFFGLVWFFITLLPASSIQPQGAVMAERFLYIPSFGIIFAASILLTESHKLAGKFISLRNARILLILVVISILSVYSYLTILRNFQWFDEKTIWYAAIEENPNYHLSYLALADFTTVNGDPMKGIDILKQGIEKNPANLQLRLRLAESYISLDMWDEALSAAKQLTELKKEYSNGYKLIGYVSQKKNDNVTAEQAYLKSIEYFPNDSQSYLYLGDISNQAKDYKKAYYYYLMASQLTTNPKIFYVLGVTSEQIKQWQNAESNYKKTIELAPENADGYLALARLYVNDGRTTQAKQVLSEGIYMTGDKQLISELERIK